MPIIGDIGFVALGEFVSLDKVYMEYAFSLETPVAEVKCNGVALKSSDRLGVAKEIQTKITDSLMTHYSPIKFDASSELDIIGTGPAGHLRAKVLTSDTWERLATRGLELTKERHLNLEHLSIGSSASSHS